MKRNLLRIVSLLIITSLLILAQPIEASAYDTFDFSSTVTLVCEQSTNSVTFKLQRTGGGPSYEYFYHYWNSNQNSSEFGSIRWDAVVSGTSETYYISDNDTVGDTRTLTFPNTSIDDKVDFDIYFVCNGSNNDTWYGSTETKAVYTGQTNTLHCSIYGSAQICKDPQPTVISRSQTSITLQWPSVAYASSYLVQYRISSSRYWQHALDTTSNSIAITGLSMGTAYDFCVTAYGETGWQNSSGGVISASTEYIYPLSAPSVTVSAPDYYTIDVSWNAISRASNYTLQYATNSSFSVAITQTVSTTSCTLSNLTHNTTYYIRVRANTTTSGYTSSSYTTKSCKTPQIPLAAPTLNTLSTIDANTLSINYTKVDNATGYTIEYSTQQDFSNKNQITAS